MRTIAILFLLILSTIPVYGQGFLDIPAGNTWTKVQDGEVIQWSIVTADDPRTRIDLVSYKEGEAKVTFFMVRTACQNGVVSKYVFKPGNLIGLGTNCDGDLAQSSRTVVDKAATLPAQASALLKP